MGSLMIIRTQLSFTAYLIQLIRGSAPTEANSSSLPPEVPSITVSPSAPPSNPSTDNVVVFPKLEQINISDVFINKAIVTQIGDTEFYNYLRAFGGTIPGLRFIDRISAMYEKHLWNIYKPIKYNALVNRKVVFVVDNSSSMASTVKSEHMELLGLLDGINPTRQHEMQFTIIGMLQALLNVQNASPDIILLNPIHINGQDQNVFNNIFRSRDAFETAMKALIYSPISGTPSVSTLCSVFSRYKSDGRSPKPHIIFFTDGQPTGGYEFGYENSKNGFYELLNDYLYKTNDYTMNIIICSDNDSDVEYLNEIDESSKNIDVTDDFITEFKQIHNANSVSVEALAKSLEVYIHKALVGCLDPSLDRADETGKKGLNKAGKSGPAGSKLITNKKGRKIKGCCSVI